MEAEEGNASEGIEVDTEEDIELVGIEAGNWLEGIEADTAFVGAEVAEYYTVLDFVAGLHSLEAVLHRLVPFGSQYCF